MKRTASERKYKRLPALAAILVALFLLAGAVPFTAFAQETPDDAPSVSVPSEDPEKDAPEADRTPEQETDETPEPPSEEELPEEETTEEVDEPEDEDQTGEAPAPESEEDDPFLQNDEAATRAQGAKDAKGSTAAFGAVFGAVNGLLDDLAVDVDSQDKLRAAIADTSNSGIITLTGDINLSSVIEITRDIVLQTDGSERTLTAAYGLDGYRHFEVDNGAALTITDGMVLTATGGRGGILANPGSTLNLQGVKITGCCIAGGGALYLDNATLIMDNSVISDNERYGSLVYYGGAIYAIGADITITNSKIKDNSVYSDGAGLYLIDGTTAYVFNTEISDNYSDSGHGAGLSVLGGSEVTLEESTLSGNWAKFGNQGGGGAAVFGSKLTLLASTVNGNEAGSSGGGLYVSDGSTLVVEGGKIHDNDSFADGAGIYAAENSTVSIDGTSIYDNTSSDHSGGGVYADFSDLSITGSTLTGNTSLSGGAIYARQGNKVTITNCTLDDNSATLGSGGAINVGTATTGTYTIGGCTITNNTANSGGGVFLDVGTGSITDTKISVNRASTGAGVYASIGSQLNIAEGSKITQNNSTGNGGGIYALGKLTVTGGEITGNEAQAYYGGGVFMTGSNAEGIVTGTTIQGNTAHTGAGVSVFNSARFTMEGSTVKSNIASASGGGLYAMTSGWFTMKNSTLEGNEAPTSGAGASLSSDSTLTMEEGSSIENHTSTNGAAVYLNTSTLDMKNSTISGNTATGYAGGVFAYNSSTVTMLESAINGNTAATYGGGAYIHTTGKLEMQDSEISENKGGYGAGVFAFSSSEVNMQGSKMNGNTASATGGGIYLSAATLTLLDGELRGNTAAGDGGAIYTDDYTSLDLDTITFAENKAATAINFDLADTAQHNASVKNLLGLSFPFYLGTDDTMNKAFNNYDISYSRGPSQVLTVTFDPNNGEATWQGFALYNQPVTKPNPAPTWGDNIFLGWYKDGTEWDFNTAVTDHINLKAEWTIVHTVTFNPANGTASWAEKVEDGELLAKPSPNPVRSGYNFLGWFAADGSEWQFASTAVNTSFALTARWEPVPTWNLSFNANGGAPKPETQSLAVGAKAKEPTAPTRTGYTLLGWQKADGSYWTFTGAGADVMPAAHVTLTAAWRVNSYSVVYHHNDEADNVSTARADYGTKLTPPENPQRYGYTFNGWTRQDGTAWDFGKDTMPDGELHLYAAWVAITTSTDDTSGGGGEPTPEPDSTSSTPVPPPASTSVPSSESSAPSSTSPSTPASSVSQSEAASSQPAAPVQEPADSGDGYTINEDGSVTYTAPDGSEMTLAEGTYTILADGRVLDHNPDSPYYVEDNGTVDLFGNPTPLGGLASVGGWGLVNLILAILAVLSTVVQLVRNLVQKRVANLPRIVAMASGLLPLLSFALLENKAQMLLFTRWTPVIAALTIVHVGLFVFSSVYRKKEAKTEEAE